MRSPFHELYIRFICLIVNLGCGTCCITGWETDLWQVKYFTHSKEWKISMVNILKRVLKANLILNKNHYKFLSNRTWKILSKNEISSKVEKWIRRQCVESFCTVSIQKNLYAVFRNLNNIGQLFRTWKRQAR